MLTVIRLLADINFSGPVVRGLLLRQPSLDLMRAQDAGLDGVDDPDVLAWAADHDRIVLTHDVATMPDFAAERVAAGLSMPGLFHLGQSRLSVARMIEELLLIDACSDQAEWSGRLVRLPL